MAKFLWSFYSAFVAVLVGLVGYSVFADGETYTCQDCYDRIIDCVTNGGSNCSSCTNCVQLSPSECTTLVQNITIEANNIRQNSEFIDALADAQLNLYDSISSELADLGDTLSQIIVTLDNFNPTNDVVGPLNSALNRAITLKSYVSSVETSYVPGTSYTYSNLLTGASVAFSWRGNISSRMDFITNSLHLAVDAYGAVESSVMETHSQVRQLVSQAQEILGYIDSNLSILRSHSNEIKSNNYYIGVSADNILSDIQSVNCEPCSKGSGSGGGSSSGGGVDFTGAEAKLEEIRALLQRMYDLVYNFYTDYNSARSSVVSHVEPSYSGYSQIGNNWFQRVEYLLYSVSPLTPSNTLEGAENPSEIEGQTEFESNVDQVESTITEQTSSLDTKVSEPLDKLKTSLNRFLEKMSVFKISQSDEGGILWSHLTVLQYGDPGSNGFRLQAANESSGVSSTFLKFQVAFRVLWFLLTLALYLYLTIFFIKFNFKVAAFILKLLNTSFGGN